MKVFPLAALLSAVAAMQAAATDLRDPMRPPSAPAAALSRTGAPSSLQVQAIIGTGQSRVAIVDGKVVRIGDTVSGARITDISEQAIYYTRGGKQLVASLPNTKISVRADKTLQAGQP